MEYSEVAIILVLFGITYYMTDPLPKTKQQKGSREKGVELEYRLHQIRNSGANVDRIYEISAELIRRGVPLDRIPRMGADTPSLAELQAKLELMIQEVPYVFRDLGVPTEDKSLAKSATQLWPRTLEQQNGDN